ncbi:MAG: type II secretion system protein, partial [Gammaproteobacteria bacterium]
VISVNTIIDTRPPLNTLSTSTPAVVVSTGPNGLGGTDLSGNVIPPPAPSATDERDNLPAIGLNPGQFVLRPYFDDAPAGCVDPACNFDDLVVWLSTPILFNRMVAAGRLP